MQRKRDNRRDFLKKSTAALATASMPYWFTVRDASANFRSPNERPILGCIGTGSRWGAVGPAAMRYSDCVAVCDVDARHAAAAKERTLKERAKYGQPGHVDVYEDYRKVLDRKDVDVVTIVTPDHWHTKIAIEAMQAGKDVYCEKPLTLTIEEGKMIVRVLEQTNRVFQVGTQQRTEMGRRFLTAIALIRDGRIGKVKRVTCNIGGAPTSGPIPKVPPPEGLNWDMWLGQAPYTDYRYKPGGRWGKSNCHYEFRWWYQYSGGKMTDWGAHHVDIAQWAIEQNGAGQGVHTVEPLVAEHPVPFKNGYPTVDDQYNTATRFDVKCMFPNGVEMHIVSHSRDGNGILFEGTKGRFFVSRGALKGRPVEELKDNPLPEDAIVKIYGGEPTSHMENFFNCVKSRKQPISDVPSHHRALTTCHLANIAIRLGRKITWDPQTEQIVGDKEAQSWQARQQRKGYEIKI
ncbi:MAG: gfo/Idh/MocA family oxidoreductase [Planctomycetota bacterium]|nr:MAG: gfo/Idh/MocA family oxidoreductase [Planctomycetota bacterium]